MTIDLSQLAAPSVVESLPFESILAATVADISSREPDLTAALELQTEPINILAQAMAYRELLLRQRINEAAKARMLAFATGTNLDHIAAGEGITRLTITAANTTAVPPVAAVMESDAALRRRVLLSFDARSTAGSVAGYQYWALSASGLVASVSVTSPSPGLVTVYILSSQGDGTATTDLLTTVAAALNADTVRPITDSVTVTSASIVTYTVTAELQIQAGPDAETIRLAALAALQTYTAACASFDAQPSLSGIYAALHQPGVTRVVLASPSAEFAALAAGQVARCTAHTITTSIIS